MARFIPHDRPESITIVIDPDKQLQPGTFEFTVDLLVERHIDLSSFGKRYRNDRVGRPALNPKILLKVILLGYSRGIITSRRIAAACRENIVIQILAAQQTPDFTTLASFVSSMEKEITEVFCDVLLMCWQAGLIGGDMFALFYDAKTKTVTALNGSGRAPAALTIDLIEQQVIVEMDDRDERGVFRLL